MAKVFKDYKDLDEFMNSDLSVEMIDQALWYESESEALCEHYCSGLGLDRGKLLADAQCTFHKKEKEDSYQAILVFFRWIDELLQRADLVEERGADHNLVEEFDRGLDQLLDVENSYIVLLGIINEIYLYMLARGAFKRGPFEELNELPPSVKVVPRVLGEDKLDTMLSFLSLDNFMKQWENVTSALTQMEIFFGLDKKLVENIEVEIEKLTKSNMFNEYESVLFDDQKGLEYTEFTSVDVLLINLFNILTWSSQIKTKRIAWLILEPLAGLLENKIRDPKALEVKVRYLKNKHKVAFKDIDRYQAKRYYSQLKSLSIDTLGPVGIYLKKQASIRKK